MKTHILRTEHTNIHAGKSRTHYAVQVIGDDNPVVVIFTPNTQREARRIARGLAKSYGCRICVVKSVHGVQYAHEL